jgi:hypothetical protein
MLSSSSLQGIVLNTNTELKLVKRGNYGNGAI